MNQSTLFSMIESFKNKSSNENQFTLPGWFNDYLDSLNVWCSLHPEYTYNTSTFGDNSCKPDCIVSFIQVYKSQ